MKSMIDSDAIEMRLRSWAHYDPGDRSTTIYYRLTGIPGMWMVLLDGSHARCDGGDPGDENDGD